MTVCKLAYGEESLLVDEKIKEWSRQYSDAGYSIVTLDMRETSISDMLVEADQTDLFASSAQKVMILKDCYFLGTEKALSDSDSKQLLDYIDNSSSDTVLIFKADKLDKRKKLGKSLTKLAETFEGKVIKYPQKWIVSRGKMYNLNISHTASEKMFAELGTSLYLLDNEIKKLKLIYPNEKNITPDMLTGISRTLESNVFELINRIVQKKASSLDILHDILITGSDAVGVVILIARQFRIMRMVKLASMSGQSINNLIDIAPYSLSIAKEQAVEYDLNEIDTKLRQLQELDLQIKRGQCNKNIALETLILEWL